MKRLFSPAIAILISLFPASGHSADMQTWPDRPIKIVVGLAAGGGTDLFTRLIANELSQKLGQPVIVENKPGAGGTVAAALVVKSPADGYTFFMASSSYATTYATYPKLSFDPFKDLRAIAQILSGPFCIVANPSIQANNLDQLIHLAKSKPNGLTYASSGNGGAGHLGGELFKELAGIELVHVPYKGSAPGITDVMAGRVDLMFVELPSVMTHVKAGKLKLIAVTSKRRAELAPDVPTVAESGLPTYGFSGWVGLLAPAGLAPAITERLNRQIVDVLNTSETRRQFSARGVEAAAGSPEEFQSQIDSELKVWRGVAERAHIVAE